MNVHPESGCRLALGSGAPCVPEVSDRQPEFRNGRRFGQFMPELKNPSSFLVQGCLSRLPSVRTNAGGVLCVR